MTDYDYFEAIAASVEILRKLTHGLINDIQKIRRMMERQPSPVRAQLLGAEQVNSLDLLLSRADLLPSELKLSDLSISRTGFRELVFKLKKVRLRLETVK